MEIITADELLAAWLAQSKAGDRTSIENQDFYGHFWSTWTRFLSGEDDARPPIPWQVVTAVDIGNFLQSGVTPRKKSAGVSEITRRRYWRLLERIYSFAVEKGWVNSNPAAALVAKPLSENPIGAVMTPKVWSHAQKALQIKEEEEGALPLRNRALLLTLFELGLTPSEVRGLTLDRVVLKDPWTGSGGFLEVEGENVKWPRKLPLSDNLRMALHAWIVARALDAGHSKSNVVFSSRRGGAMTDENLLVLVRKHLITAAEAAGQPPPARLGPQIIRNTRLVFWLNDRVPVEDVVKRAGLKNSKGLYHLLEYLPEDVRVQIRNQRDDAPREDLPKPSLPGIYVKQPSLFADEFQ